MYRNERVGHITELSHNRSVTRGETTSTEGGVGWGCVMEGPPGEGRGDV